MQDGSVVAWGSPTGGGKLDVALTDVVKIASSNDAFYALRSDGTVYGWGNKLKYGDLNSPYDMGFIVDIYTNEGMVAAILSDGGIALFGDRQKITVEPSNDITGFKALCAGHAYFTAIYGDDRNVATFGNTDLGISAVSSSLVGVQQVFCTWEASAALMEDGNLVAWGEDGSPSGNNTVPSTLSNIETVFNNVFAFAALDISGNVHCWGGTKGSPSADVGGNCSLTNVKTVAATYKAFAALHHDGTVTVWGDDWYGTESDGTVVSAPTDLENIVQIHSHATVFCALSELGEVSCWGNTKYGTTIPSYVPTTGLVSMASTQYSMVAVSNESYAYMWGYINTCCPGQPTILSGVAESYGNLQSRAISSYPSVRTLDDFVPYPSGQPTSMPTSSPITHPTSAPSASPTAWPTLHPDSLSQDWSHAGALNQSAFSAGRGIMFHGEHRFSGLGDPTREGFSLFLTLDLFDTGFGPPLSGQFVEYQINGRTVTIGGAGAAEAFGGNKSDTLKCAPRRTIGDAVYCTDAYITCAYNIDVTSEVQSHFGGSILVSSTSHGVLSSACSHLSEDGTRSIVYVKFRLTKNPVMTPGPTSPPSPSPTRPYTISGLQLSFDSMDVWELLQISISIGLLLACFAAALCVVRNRSKAVHKFPVAYATIRTGMLGMELCSMIFLIIKLIRSPFGASGIALACFRLIQVLVSSSVLLCIHSSETGPARQFSDLLPFIDKEHLVTESKVYTVVSILCLVDCAFIAFLPWRESRFSMMSKGFPVMWVWRVTNITIVTSVVVSLGCQVPYLSDSNAFDVQRDLIFVINIILLSLKLLIVGFEYYFKSHVLAGTEREEEIVKQGAAEGKVPGELDDAHMEMTENPLALAAANRKDEEAPLLRRRLEALEVEMRGMKGLLFQNGITSAKRTSIKKTVEV